VQRREREGGLFTDHQAWVYLVGVRDGEPVARQTYAPYPFVDDSGELVVRFDPDRIVLTGPDGVEVSYPESYYALD